MVHLFVPVVLILIALLPRGVIQAEGNWPQWRGPNQNGVGAATNLPTTWSLNENIVWKTPLPSWSAGTPIIWDDQIFVTSPSESLKDMPQQRRGMRRGRDPGGSELLLISIFKRDGTELWRQVLGRGNRLHRKGNSSSASPVTDGKHVWVVTGTGVVASFDMKGRRIWKRNLQDDYGDFGLNWGYASSPLLHHGKLIIQVLHGYHTDDPSYVVAFNTITGKEEWRQERWTDALSESPDAYTTPALLESNGKSQFVISGGDYVTGHDPESGQEIWRVAGLNPERRRAYRIVASPLAVDGMVYAPTRKTPLLALSVDVIENIAASRIVWKWDEGAAPDVPTPVCDGKYFYMVDDKGLVTCLNAKTGAVIWGPERTAQGTVSASPILADGKIYLTNEFAVTTVLAAGPQFKKLATNELDGSYTLSSPAVSGSQLFIRTSTHLYCIGENTY